LSGNITVLAASSLTESFTEIGKAFEAAHPGTKVTFSFAASSALVTQINSGAPADVFAAADTTSVGKLTNASKLTPKNFATNKLQIIVAKGNPRNIASLADLAKPGITYVTAGADVPIRKYSDQVLVKANLTLTPKSLETSAKGIVSKVTLGEADAGIVYVTDVLAAASKAQGVEIPDAQNVVTAYSLAALGTSNSDVANAFADFITGTQGQAALKKFGFGTV
jgi:molybdate transport system substrate-binding protein